MRTFGADVDNLIDAELAYGTNNYKTSWYQNGLSIDINVTRGIFHYVGSKIPVGNILKDYVQIETDYLDFLEEDVIGVEFIKDDVALNVGTFYVVPGYTKTIHKATYTAYSSLIDLGIKLNKWVEAPNNATIGEIVHHFIDPIEITFDIEPTNSIEFNASITSFENMTLQQLLGYCAFLEGCNYKLVGNVLYKINTSIGISKKYDIDDVVYSNNLSKKASDKVLDFIKVNYSVSVADTDEDGTVSYDFSDARCVSGDESGQCGFEVSFGVIPNDVIQFEAYVDSYFRSIKGLDWNDYDITFLGDARTEVGDRLCFENATTTAVMCVGELTWTWDGALKSQVTSGSADASGDSRSGFNLSQVVSQIQAMGNALKNVQYNAVYANMLHAKVAEFGYASIDELSAEVAKMGLMTAEEADIKYANIDFSNVKVESVGQLFADAGLIEDLTIVDGKVTGMLSSVKINADVITTGTLAVDRLLVTGENSIVYQINVDSSGLSEKELEDEKYQKYLNGTDIVANSITSTQIAAKAITADKIEAGAVTAEKIDVLSLSAISANLGTVTAGVIQSENYDSDSTGMKLDLTTGIWDSRYFKLSKEGKIKATAGVLGCFELTETGLNNSVLKILSNGSNTARFSIYDPTMANPVFDVEMSHPADNSAWTHFNIINMNEIVLSADDVYLGKNVWLTNDVSTEDGITLRTLSKTKVNQISPILYSPHFKWAIGAGTSPAIDESYPQVQLRQTGSAGAYSLSLVYYESSASRVFNEIINKNGNFLPNCLKTTGGTMTGEIISTSSNGFRIANRYGVLIRNDGSNTYLLLTNSGNASGTFNALRPFVVNNDTGEVTLGQDTTVKGILTASGKVRLTGNVNSSYIYNNTSSSSANVYIGTSYNFCRSTSSSKRYKHDITTILCEELRPEQLYDIDVVQYKYDADYLGKSDIRHLKDVIGFIAEDIYEKYRIAANYSIDEETGEVVVEDWDARYIIPAMLKLIQEQHERIKKLENNQ